MRRTSRAAAAALAVICAGVLVGPTPRAASADGVAGSGATAPVRNGRIFFSPGLLIPLPEYDGTPQVYSVAPDGSHLKALTHVPDGAAAGAPSVSPDGRTVAYTSNEGGTFALMTMSRSGRHQRQVLGTPDQDYLMPSWSPDGARLVLSACDISLGFEGWCDLVTVRPDGSDLHTVLADHRYHGGGQYSPDGRWIEFQSDRAGLQGAIWVIRAGGGTPHRVTPPRLEAFFATWTPDGRHLTFADNCCQPHSNLYTIARSGRHLRRLTHVPFPHNAVLAAYSPDGRRLVFSSDVAYPVGSPKSDLYTMRADGTDVRRIVTSVQPAFQSSWGRVPTPARAKGTTR